MIHEFNTTDATPEQIANLEMLAHDGQCIGAHILDAEYWAQAEANKDDPDYWTEIVEEWLKVSFEEYCL